MKKMKDTTPGKKSKKESKQSAAAPTDLPEVKEDSFESPESSNIVRASYDVEAQACFITFKGKGSTPDRIYLYQLPPTVWLEFKNSISKGKFCNSRIVPNYDGVLQ